MTHDLLRRLAAALMAVALPVLGALGPSAGPAAAITPSGYLIVVNTASDLVDPGDGTCSLRAAIEASNVGGYAGNCQGSAYKDGIHFDLGGGVPVINVNSDLPQITQPINISGATGGATRVKLNGPGSGTGLYVSGAGSSISGLAITNFQIGMHVDASDVTVTGNHLGPNTNYGIEATSPGTTIGGTNPTPSSCSAPCNLISGNGGGGLNLAAGGTVEGNFIGTNAAGTKAKPNGKGLIVSSGTWTIGGTTAGERNLISGNTHEGIDLHGCTCTIEGNFIGTDVTGMSALPNGTGIALEYSSGTIGGSTSGAGNVISGNLGSGIAAAQSSKNYPTIVDILGNHIGTKVTGAALGNGGDGISVENTSGSDGVERLVVGTTSGGTGNEIAFNGGTGVRVSGVLATDEQIRGNSIYDNKRLGIALTGGANESIAPPTITGTAPVAGTACANCSVDVYSDSADEGRIFEGSAIADSGGNWSYPGSVSGPNVTATNTNANNETSSFSTPFAVPQPYQPDGRIRKGHGAYVGNDIYNTTGINQTRTGKAARGHTIVFGISIQNDGPSDRITVLASGANVTGYRVRYFRGTTEITAAVLAGTYKTPLLASGDKFLIKAKVKITRKAAVGSSVSRLVTLTSVNDNGQQDAVGFVAKRR